MQLQSYLTKFVVGATAVTGTAVTIGAGVVLLKEYKGNNQASTSASASPLRGDGNGNSSTNSNSNDNTYVNLNNNEPSNEKAAAGYPQEGYQLPEQQHQEQEEDVVVESNNNILSGTDGGQQHETAKNNLRSQPTSSASNTFQRQAGNGDCVTNLNQLESKLQAKESTIHLCNGSYLPGFDSKSKGIIDHEVTIVCHESDTPAANTLTGFRGTTTERNPTQSLYFIQSKVTFQDCLFENLYEPLWVMDGGHLVLTNTIFQDNEGINAGAITYNEGVGLEITESTFSNNMGIDEVSAGAIRFVGTSDWKGFFHSNNNVFYNNSGGWIGAVYVDQIEDIAIVGTKFEANHCIQCSECLVGMCLG